MPPEKDLDENQQVTPATESSTVDQTQTNADSSPAAGAKPETMDDVTEQVIAKLDEPPVAEPPPAKGQEDAQASSGDVQPLNKTKEADKKADKEQADVKDKDSYESLPFHKHERFQEIIKEKQSLKQQVETAQPMLQRLHQLDTFLSSSGISEEDFRNGLETMRLLKSDPAAARKRLQPLIDELDRFQGTKLPDDLQAEVVAGTLHEARAQEIASLRAQKDFIQRRSQQTAQQTEEQQVHSAFSAWEQNGYKTDPDFARKVPMIKGTWLNLCREEGWNGKPDTGVALLQRAYDEVNAYNKGFLPKPAASKTLTSNGHSASTNNQRQTTEWSDDSVNEIARSFIGR